MTQSVRAVAINKKRLIEQDSVTSDLDNILSTGNSALVRFKFVIHPELLRRGQRMILMEGYPQAVGIITKTYA